MAKTLKRIIEHVVLCRVAALVIGIVGGSVQQFALAQPTSFEDIEISEISIGQIRLDETGRNAWGLSEPDWDTYLSLMSGPSGLWFWASTLKQTVNGCASPEWSGNRNVCSLTHCLHSIVLISKWHVLNVIGPVSVSSRKPCSNPRSNIHTGPALTQAELPLSLVMTALFATTKSRACLHQDGHLMCM